MAFMSLVLLCAIYFMLNEIKKSIESLSKTVEILTSSMVKIEEEVEAIDQTTEK